MADSYDSSGGYGLDTDGTSDSNYGSGGGLPAYSGSPGGSTSGKLAFPTQDTTTSAPATYTQPIPAPPSPVLYSGTFTVQFKFSAGTVGTITGLQASASDALTYRDLTYSVYRTLHGVYVLEYGVQKWGLYEESDTPGVYYTVTTKDSTPVAAPSVDALLSTDMYKIVRDSDGAARYYRNGTLFYSSATEETGNMLLLSYFFRATDTIEAFYSNYTTTSAFSLQTTAHASNDVAPFAVTDVLRHTDGTFYVCGHFDTFGDGDEEIPRVFLAHLYSDGALDTAFAPDYSGIAYEVGPSTTDWSATADKYFQSNYRSQGLYVHGGYLIAPIGRYLAKVALATGVASTPAIRELTGLDDANGLGTNATWLTYTLTTSSGATPGGILVGSAGLGWAGVNEHTSELQRINPSSFDVDYSNTAFDTDDVRFLAKLSTGSVLWYDDDGVADSHFKTTDRSGATAVSLSGVIPAIWDGAAGDDASVVEGAIIQTNGRVVFFGCFNHISATTATIGSGTNVVAIARMNSAMTGIETYSGLSAIGASAVHQRDSGALTNLGTILTAAVDLSGNIYIGGDFASINGNATYKNLARLTSSLVLDTTFVPAGTTNLPVRKLVALPDGRVLVAGEFTTFGGNPVGGIIMLDNDGSINADFLTSVRAPDTSATPYNEWNATNGPPSFRALSCRGGLPSNDGYMSFEPLFMDAGSETLALVDYPESGANIALAPMEALGTDDFTAMNAADVELAFEPLSVAGSWSTAYSEGLSLGPMTCTANTLASVPNNLNGKFIYDMEADDTLAIETTAQHNQTVTVTTDTSVGTRTTERAVISKEGDGTVELVVDTTDGSSAIYHQYVTFAAALVGSPQELAAVYEAWAMNIKTGAHTRYSNFPFVSFTTFDGQVYAASEDGLFILGGDTDDGTAIDSLLLLGRTDFGSSKQKRISEAYLGLESDGEMELTVIDDNDEFFQYTPRRDKAYMAGARVQIGKGLVSRYWQFQIANVDGADFELDTFEVNIHKASRRDI